jgi:ATP-dependent DNA helicase RecG
VAFANADGGELLIGIEDDGAVTGIPHSDSEIEQMLAATKTHVYPGSELPMLSATKLELSGKVILFFAVTKGTREIYQLSDGKCVRRKDKSTVPSHIQAIIFERQEVRSREYDRQFVDGATVNDLNVPFVKSLADHYLRGLSVELYLQQISIAEYGMVGLRLRMAALLLFAKDMQHWHPRSQVRILKVKGTHLESGERYNVISDETVRGNIFELLERSWEQLRPYLAYKTEFGTDAKFEQRYIYPEWACREALINAIAHRDYSIQNGIEVFIFDDRMEIKSPGALLSTLTIQGLEELQGSHESRNVLIAKVLRENQYMRELGEGMKRMFEWMEQNELEKPKLYSNDTWFSVTLSHKSVFTEQQLQWLGLFEPFNLSRHQKRIVGLGMDGREFSRQDVYRAMSTDDRDVYDREVTGLRNLNILVVTKSQQETKVEANKRRIDRERVPRFAVKVPEIAVDWRQRNPALCVFVYNLPYTVTEQELKNVFQKCGRVEEVIIPLDMYTTRPRGHGYVWYVSPASSKKAIQELNGIEIHGRSMVVTKYVKPSRSNLA